jgi:hypothetical protein
VEQPADELSVCLFRLHDRYVTRVQVQSLWRRHTESRTELTDKFVAASKRSIDGQNHKRRPGGRDVVTFNMRGKELVHFRTMGPEPPQEMQLRQEGLEHSQGPARSSARRRDDNKRNETTCTFLMLESTGLQVVLCDGFDE